MDKKFIDKNDLKLAKVKQQDQIKTVYQFSHSLCEIYQESFLKQAPRSIFLDFEKMNYLETINNEHFILPSSLLFDSKTNQYLGYETKIQSYKELKTYLKSSKNNLDSITDYYLQIDTMIKEAHHHHMVIPALFWDTHLFIDPDTNEIYCTNLVHAQIKEFPAMIVDPKLYLLYQKHLPNVYRSQFLFHPNADYISLLSYYFYDCTSLDLLASFCYQINHPEIIYRFFQTFGLQNETDFRNMCYQLFSNTEVQDPQVSQYLLQLLDNYETISVPNIPKLKKFIKVKNKALSRS
mgnify:CR=1 FL=1